MSRSFYTGTDAQMATGSANFAGLISGAPATYGLTAAQSTEYGTLDTDFQTKYSLAIEPTTRTPVAIENKNLSRKLLKDKAVLLASIIKSTPTVTSAQLLALGLSVRPAFAPVPAPSTTPEIDFVSVVNRIITIRLHDSVHTGRGLPPGVTSATIFSHAGANPPEAIGEWKYEGVTTRALCEIVVPDSVAGGTTIWVTAIWANNKAQSGNAADPVSINIAGGGVSTVG